MNNFLLEGKMNSYIEEAVQNATGLPFHIQEIKRVSNGSMHPVAIFVGDRFSVFVKAGSNSFSNEHFHTEAFELEYIRKHSSVKAPEVIAVTQVQDITLLILEAIQTVKPESKKDWETLGRGLASLHRTENERCGFERETFLGIFKQDNTWKNTWTEFYGECRLRDTMKIAQKAGKMNSEECAIIERLIDALLSLEIPQEAHSLLHGDPWLGNLLYDGKELVIIDCSIYYGNREIDLTTVDFFCPVSNYFFDAYREQYPVQEGFEKRADLWKINQWLGHIALYGDRYKKHLFDAVNKYL